MAKRTVTPAEQLRKLSDHQSGPLAVTESLEKSIIDQIAEINGCEIGVGLDSLKVITDLLFQPQDLMDTGHIWSLLEAVRCCMQSAKNKIDELCSEPARAEAARG